MENKISDDFKEYVRYCYEHGAALKAHKFFLSSSNELVDRIVAQETDLISTRAARAEVQKATEWIPVAERLPEESKDYLVLRNWEPSFSHWYGGTHNFSGDEQSNFAVDYWIEKPLLPQPPEEEEDEVAKIINESRFQVGIGNVSGDVHRRLIDSFLPESQK